MRALIYDEYEDRDDNINPNPKASICASLEHQYIYK